MGAKRTGSMRPKPPLVIGRHVWAQERDERVVRRQC